MTTRIAPLRSALAVAAALLVSLAVMAPAAGASEVTKIFEECVNGTLPTGFTQHAYSQAIKEMEAELSEYSDCPDLIHKAQLAGAAGSHGGPGSSGPTGSSGSSSSVAPPTPTEQRTLESIPHAGAPRVHVGGEVLHPGVVHVDIASALSTLPTPLFALLAFLLACAVLLVGQIARNRIRRAGGPSTGD